MSDLDIISSVAQVEEVLGDRTTWKDGVENTVMQAEQLSLQLEQFRPDVKIDTLGLSGFKEFKGRDHVQACEKIVSALGQDSSTIDEVRTAKFAFEKVKLSLKKRLESLGPDGPGKEYEFTIFARRYGYDISFRLLYYYGGWHVRYMAHNGDCDSEGEPYLRMNFEQLGIRPPHAIGGKLHSVWCQLNDGNIDKTEAQRLIQQIANIVTESERAKA